MTGLLSWWRSIREYAADLLEFELDRNRILSCDGVCYIIANPERLLLCLPAQVYEQGIRIAINDASAPFLIRLNEPNRLKDSIRLVMNLEAPRIERTFSRVSLPL